MFSGKRKLSENSSSDQQNSPTSPSTVTLAEKKNVSPLRPLVNNAPLVKTQISSQNKIISNGMYKSN